MQILCFFNKYFKDKVIFLVLRSMYVIKLQFIDRDENVSKYNFYMLR